MPRILYVVRRDEPFWLTTGYELLREKTRHHVIACAYAGQGTLEVNGQRSLLTPGAVFIMKPADSIRISTDSPHTLCYLCIHFHYALTRWEGDESYGEPGMNRLPFSISQHPNHPLLLERFQDAYAQWNAKNAGYEWRVKLALLEILQQLVLAEALVEEPAATKAVHVAIDYMKVHYSEAISRDLLAAHVALSPGYFSTIFKAHTGLSPVRYLNKIRLDRAKQLLKTSALPVQRVAEESGFTDSFYFARLFGKETGMSPREYRNS